MSIRTGSCMIFPMNKLFPILLILMAFSACTPAANTPSPTSPATPTTGVLSSPTAPGTALIPTQIIPCVLTPVVAPTPAKDPGYTQLDETTGLHVTGTAKEIDLASYRLKVTGLVDRPLSLTYDELRCMPRVTDHPVLVCQGYFEDVANWTGVPLKYVLDMAGVQAGAKKVILTAADGYSTTLQLVDALLPGNFLAYELEGKPVPVLHGFPLRAVIPSMKGYAWVKWLVEMRVE